MQIQQVILPLKVFGTRQGSPQVQHPPVLRWSIHDAEHSFAAQIGIAARIKSSVVIRFQLSISVNSRWFCFSS
jgi:hypothetical protein